MKTKDHLQTTQANIRSTDTTVSFSIDGLSSEGSEASVHYVNGRISTAKWSIFGETGQLFIEYKFLTDGTVKASEKKYEYKTDLTSVSSDSDMELISSFCCTLDTNGILRSKPNARGFVDVFAAFKKAVPFELKHLR
ncbi:hypothetical protein [Chitinophaga parva]|nr:hypothetical protein [Chitinophaga parva]